MGEPIETERKPRSVFTVAVALSWCVGLGLFVACSDNKPEVLQPREMSRSYGFDIDKARIVNTESGEVVGPAFIQSKEERGARYVRRGNTVKELEAAPWEPSGHLEMLPTLGGTAVDFEEDEAFQKTLDESSRKADAYLCAKGLMPKEIWNKECGRLTIKEMSAARTRIQETALDRMAARLGQCAEKCQ